MRELIPVYMSCDDNYVTHLCVVIASVLSNTKSDIHFVILVSSLSEHNKTLISAVCGENKVSFIDVKQRLHSIPIEVKCSHISLDTCSRFFISEFDFPYKKGIYLDCDVVVNIQGDEPFIHPSQIKAVCDCFNDPSTQIATLGKPFTDMESVENPNSPKIVVNNSNNAMYFSRSVIPFIRGVERNQWIDQFPFLKHLGIYAYKKEVLAEITRLPQSSLEKAESLEQLRWLQNGYVIKVGTTDLETIGIDTPDDLIRAEKVLEQLKKKE